MSRQHRFSDLGESRRLGSMEESLRSQTHSYRYYGHTSMSGPRQLLLVAVLLLGLLFSSIDASIVSTSLVTISLDLHDFLNAPWAALSYLLAYLGFAIAFAKMSDIYGRRCLVIVAWVLFAGASIGCGLAQNMASLVVCRSLQGVGGSGLYSLSQIGLFEVGPSHRPSLMGALIGMTLAISFILGPVLGATISNLLNWRWIFFINIPCGIVALLAIGFAWPREVAYDFNHREALRSIDFPGNILMISASSLLVFALQQAGSSNESWASPTTVASLVVAALSFIAFMAWEMYLGCGHFKTIQPIFPLQLANNRVYLAALVCTLFSGYAYLATIIILPERFQIVNGDDSLMAGVHLLPMLGGCAFGSFLAGALSAKRNNTSITLILASALQLTGIGLLSTLSDILDAIQAQYGYQAIFGLGIGLSFGAATILSSVQSHPGDLAVAQGAMAQARVLGGAVGIAVCTIILNMEIQNDLYGKMPAEDLEALHRSPSISSYFPPDIQTSIRKSYATAFTNDIKVMICVCAASFVASVLTFEACPPSMPTHNERKKPLILPQGRSETELEDLPRDTQAHW
ncbi:major facilitator superfamily domain-containing protein [Xylariales sp. PMI_506]|nr:major facilitator superfamily domain-containing protein [Xylariales sp. PMI_506]